MLEVNSCGVAHINDGVRRIIQALVETHSETVRHELKKLGLGIARTMDEYEVGAILREKNIGDSKWKLLHRLLRHFLEVPVCVSGSK